MTYGLSVDVGTTFTAAAIWRDGRAKVVPLGDRSNTVPSVLFVRDDGVMLVGEAANRRAVTEPDRVAPEFKRRLGDRVPVRLGDRDLTPQVLLAAMLGWGHCCIWRSLPSASSTGPLNDAVDTRD